MAFGNVPGVEVQLIAVSPQDKTMGDPLQLISLDGEDTYHFDTDNPWRVHPMLIEKPAITGTL